MHQLHLSATLSPMLMNWPKWKPLSWLEAQRATKIMTGDREPLENFLSAEPPRSLNLQRQANDCFEPLDEIYQQLIDHWWATRGWIYGSRSTPDREGPILELDIVFFAGDIPAGVTFSQNNDAMHWAGSQRRHHDWYQSLMKSKGDPVTVLFEPAEHQCFLFGDMDSYIFRTFESLLHEAKTTEDPEEKRQLLYNCIDIVLHMEDHDRAKRAVARFNRDTASSDEDQWYRSTAGLIRRNDPVVVQLERMLPEIAGEGYSFWAAI